MKHTLLAAGLLVCGACRSSSTPSTPDTVAQDTPDPALVASRRAQDIAERVRQEVDCDDPMWQFLCVVGEIGKPGQSPALAWPEASMLLGGVSVGVRPSRTILGGAGETLRLVVGELGPEGLWTAEPAGADDASRNLVFDTRNRVARMFGDSELALDGVIPDPIIDALTHPAPLPSPITVQGEAYRADNAVVYPVPPTEKHLGAWVVVEAYGQGARLRVLLEPPTSESNVQ